MGRAVCLVHIAIGAGMGLLLLRIVAADDPFFLPELILGLFLYVALHEAGHAIVAVQQGFRLLTYAIWPLAFERRAGSWRVRWIGRVRAAGFVAADPVSGENLRRRLMLLVAGGPMASALTAVVAALLALLLRASWPHWAVNELELLAFWSGTSLLTGLIPFSSRFATNDGARLWMLWKGNEAADRFGCMLLLSSASRSGVRPRELNGEIIARLPGPADGSIDWITASLFRYNWFVDTDRLPEAHAALISILERDLPPAAREILLLQAASFEARFHHDLEAAQRWMKAAKISGRRDDGYRTTLLRAQAGIAFLEGKFDEAEKLAHESLRHCARLDDRGAMIVIRERTEELLAEIAAARAAQAERAS